METKKCTKCLAEKEVVDFYKQPLGKYSVTARCKVCTKKYREKNKDRNKEYREKNKEIRAQQRIEYNDRNREKIRVYFKESTAYINSLLKAAGLDTSKVPNEIKEQYKETLLLKRQLKNEHHASN